MNIPTLSRICHVLASMALALACGPALGAPPCAGFDDVDQLSPFCQNIEWIRNRGVTLGCGPSAYCPQQQVTREQMAAFMNRLGTALTPRRLLVETSPGAIDVDASSVVCQTTDYVVSPPPVNFPQRAFLDLVFAGQAPAAIDIAVDVVVSTNSGANWAPVNTLSTRGSVPANGWGNIAGLGVADLAAGSTVRFGVRVNRVSGTADLADSRCNLHVAIGSRDGTSSPF